MDKYYNDFMRGWFNHHELSVTEYQNIVLPYLINRIKEKDAKIEKLQKQNKNYKTAISFVEYESEEK